MSAPSSRRFQGYLAGRTAVLAALLALGALFQARLQGFSLPFTWFFGLTALSFAFTAASAAGLRRGRRPSPAWLKVQPAWDVGYATVLVFLSGGAFSPFASLYPLAITGAAIVLHRKGALVTATASSAAYGLLVGLQAGGFLHPLNPFPLPETAGGKILLQLGFNLLAFYAVAILSGYLAEELRRADQSLQQARDEVLHLEYLKDAILQSLGSGLVALDRSGRVLFHNRWAEELLARAGHRLAAGEDLTRLFDVTGGVRNEVSFQDGELVVGYSVSPLQDPDGTPQGHILIFQDLTEVKRLEAELGRADRLAAVGRLAAGLAHEVRNPLASLSGSVEMLRHSLEPSGESADLFDIVLRETERLNRLVTNFLLYARPGRVQPSGVVLKDLVDQTGFFFAHGEGRTGFSLDNQVPGDLALRADPDQLEQVFLNLFRNSREAAPAGVTVTVDAVRRDGEIQVTYRDDGPGMDPTEAERAFEPFFSRKEGGTGLGLATIHRIVQNHAGTVSLETLPGAGVTFRLRFPDPADEETAP